MEIVFYRVPSFHVNLTMTVNSEMFFAHVAWAINLVQV